MSFLLSWGNMIVRSLLALALVLAWAVPSFADPPPLPRTYTLESSLETGLRQNPALRVAEEQVASAAAQYDQQQSQKNLTFGFGSQTALQPKRSITAGPLGTFPLLDSISSQINTSLGVLLTTFGRVENEIAAAFLQIGVQSENVRTTRRNVGYSVKQAFFGRLKADATVKVATLNLQVSEQNLSDTQKLFKQGVMARYDVVQADLQVTESIQQLADARTSVDTSTATFLTVLNEKTRGPIALEPPDPIVVEDGLTVDSLQELALRARPEVISLNRSLEVARTLLVAAENESKPNVTLSADYYTNPGIALSAQDHYQLTLGVSWLLMDGGFRDGKVAEAESQIRSIEASGEELRNNISLDVETAWLNFQLTTFTMETARKRVEAAEVYYDMARQRFLNGLGTSLEVQDALRSLNNARQQQVVATYNRDLAFAAIENAVGVDFPDRRMAVTPEMLEGNEK